VTHSFPHTNRHFRAGTYDSKEEALKAAETLDPINPKVRREAFLSRTFSFSHLGGLLKTKYTFVF
jgi:hypothetical protein